MLFEAMLDSVPDIEVVRSVILRKEGGIIIEDNLTPLVVLVVVVEVVDELGDLPLVLDEERLEHSQLAITTNLRAHHPVDILISVEGDDDWQSLVEVAVLTAVVRYAATFFGSYILECQLAAGCSVQINVLTHTAIESISRDVDADAHYRCHER